MKGNRQRSVCAHVCVHMWRPEVIVSHLPQSLYSPPQFLEQGLSLNPVSFARLRGTSGSRDPSVSHPQACGMYPHTTLFCMSAGVLNSGPHTCMETTLLIKPSPQIPKISYLRTQIPFLGLCLPDLTTAAKSSLLDATIFALRFKHSPLHSTLRNPNCVSSLFEKNYILVDLKVYTHFSINEKN